MNKDDWWDVAPIIFIGIGVLLCAYFLIPTFVEVIKAIPDPEERGLTRIAFSIFLSSWIISRSK